MLYFMRNANIRFVEENSSKKERGREEIAKHSLNKRNEWTHETRNVDERVSRVRRLVGTEGNGCVNAREGS